MFFFFLTYVDLQKVKEMEEEERASRMQPGEAKKAMKAGIKSMKAGIKSVQAGIKSVQAGISSTKVGIPMQ
jgi:hypothetical protein